LENIFTCFNSTLFKYTTATIRRYLSS